MFGETNPHNTVTLDDIGNTESFSVSINSNNGSLNQAKPALLPEFEDEFKEKYKVKFEDFIEAVLKDYPELKI